MRQLQTINQNLQQQSVFSVIKEQQNILSAQIIESSLPFTSNVTLNEFNQSHRLIFQHQDDQTLLNRRLSVSPVSSASSVTSSNQSTSPQINFLTLYNTIIDSNVWRPW